MKNAVKRIFDDYFLAKFRFDTAENEPTKNLQKICKILLIFPILLTVTPNPPLAQSSTKLRPAPSAWGGGPGAPGGPGRAAGGAPRASPARSTEVHHPRAHQGSFSVVSMPNFASKYA